MRIARSAAKKRQLAVSGGVMDYRDFLTEPTCEVLPYLGGPHVVAASRRYRVTADAEPGWWSFELSGRRATATEPAEAPFLDDRPRVTGHLSGDRLFAPGGHTELIYLLPADEPPRFSLCIARRWHSDDLLFDGLEFETEVEEEARRAYEDDGTLAGVAGVPATLRAAFGFAIAERAARASEVTLHPAEISASLLEIAERGSQAVAGLIADIVARRERFRAQALARRAQRQAQELARNAEVRAERALLAAGAEPLSIRSRGDGQLAVRYRFGGARFETIVDAATLQVIDAGFCLAGADRELTLESLPSAIREAIDTNQLHVW